MATNGKVETRLLIVFLDLTRFAKESEHRDDTEVAETIDAFYALVADAVAAAGGRVVKFIGDATLVVFPETDVDRGVRAVAELAPAVERFFAARGWECRLTAKIHFGSVVAGAFGPPGDERFDVIGRAVNRTVKLPSGDLTLSDEALGRVSAEVRQQLAR